jgi:3alpha(or 20beta)-hydroxysteroid dehydrogenase
LDVTVEAGWTRLADDVRERHGRLDILVNNAGVAYRFGLMETARADFERVLGVNLVGPFLAMRALAPLIRDSGGGSIVNVGSAAGMTGHFSAAYSASKWGLRGVSKVAAMEFAPWQVRVNAIHPGIVNTAIVPGDTAFPTAMSRFTPLGRAAEVEDIAPLVLFLAGDGSRFITGSDFSVDGGLVDLGVYDAVVKAYEELK